MITIINCNNMLLIIYIINKYIVIQHITADRIVANDIVNVQKHRYNR